MSALDYHGREPFVEIKVFDLPWRKQPSADELREATLVAVRRVLCDPSLRAHLKMMNSASAKAMYKAMGEVVDCAGKYFFEPAETALVVEGPKAMVLYRGGRA